MDYSEIENITADINNAVPISASNARIYQEIAVTIFLGIGICADLAIAYTILQFKRLKTPTNIFIANWAIADMCSLIVTPSVYGLMSVITRLPIPYAFLIVVEVFGLLLHVLVMVFAITVLLDWFISAYFEKIAQKIHDNYKILVTVLWLLCIGYGAILSILSLETYYFIHVPYLVVGCYFLLILLTIVCHCSRAVQKCRKKQILYSTFSLYLATAYAGESLLGILGILFINIVKFHKALFVFIGCLFFSSSVVNLVLFYFFDTDFQACFRQVLKRTGDSYEESICNFDNPLIHNNEKDVKISLHNSDECLNS